MASMTAIRATPTDEEVQQVLDGAIRDFGGRLPARTVRQVIAAAEQDLAGQVPPPAIAELLHRLLTYRLASLTGRREITT